MPAPLNPPDPTPQTPQQIATALATLYAAPPTIAKYGAYFYLHNFLFSDFLLETGFAMNVGGQCYTTTYSQFPGAQNVELFIQDLSSLNTSATKLFSGPTQAYQVFISMDRISSTGTQGTILLPYQTAKLLSSAFIYGLATRLILDQYKQAWSGVGMALPYDLPIVAAPPKTPPAVIPAPLNAADWCQQYLSTLSTKLVIPATWTAASAAHANTDYFGCLSVLTDSSLQAVGIMMGWLAGDAITADPNAATYRTAFWTLLRGRNGQNDPNYTVVQIGMMVGYTFTYLSGFLSSERSKAMIAGNVPPQAMTDPVGSPSAIFGYLSMNTNTSAASIPPNVGNQLFSFIVQEFYAVSSDATKAQQYQGFIQGFEQGLLLGADVMYQLLYTEAYYLGYTNGFRDGYTQGYSAGWTAGYGTGYAAGQNNWMSGLSNIFGGLSQTLGSANTILSNAGYVVSVISSIF